MHCAICDKEDDSVSPYNSDCRECQAIIYDTILGYDQLNEYEDEQEEEEDLHTRI